LEVSARFFQKKEQKTHTALTSRKQKTENKNTEATQN
jgi:hypothetical protein